jgi:hypothetical protein
MTYPRRTGIKSTSAKTETATEYFTVTLKVNRTINPGTSERHVGEAMNIVVRAETLDGAITKAIKFAELERDMPSIIAGEKSDEGYDEEEDEDIRG